MSIYFFNNTNVALVHWCTRHNFSLGNENKSKMTRDWYLSYTLCDATFWWHEYGKQAIFIESD